MRRFSFGSVQAMQPCGKDLCDFVVQPLPSQQPLNMHRPPPPPPPPTLALPTRRLSLHSVINKKGESH